MIKLFLDNKPIRFETTIFPDGTSQIWKVDFPIELVEISNIYWMFESEAELIHVAQLAQLIRSTAGRDSYLNCPYLPYGRQDKDINNNQTFALTTFKTLLKASGIISVLTVDAHSVHSSFINSDDASVRYFHREYSDYDIICFPDQGARLRYSNNFTNIQMFCEKIRDNKTGEILGLKIAGGRDNFFYNKLISNNKILIVDDICDGGMTFVKVAELLKKHDPAQVDLAVTHGLFSKGKQVLYDAGITNIFTTNSLLRNPDGFKVVPDDYLR